MCVCGFMCVYMRPTKLGGRIYISGQVSHECQALDQPKCRHSKI